MTELAMTKLALLSHEVSKCPIVGVLKRRKYSQSLRARIFSASLKYGQGTVARATGVSQSLIARWRQQKVPLSPLGRHNKRDRPIIIKELPSMKASSASSPNENHSNRPTLKITTPSGFSLELSSCSSVDVLSIVNGLIVGGGR